MSHSKTEIIFCCNNPTHTQNEHSLSRSLSNSIASPVSPPIKSVDECCTIKSRLRHTDCVDEWRRKAPYNDFAEYRSLSLFSSKPKLYSKARRDSDSFDSGLGRSVRSSYSNDSNPAMPEKRPLLSEISLPSFGLLVFPWFLVLHAWSTPPRTTSSHNVHSFPGGNGFRKTVTEPPKKRCRTSSRKYHSC